ncbi:MAG: iron transporter FeoB [Firmicutes bacterium]|nr:iron transporter FeoB [Bacillota bacterium]
MAQVGSKHIQHVIALMGNPNTGKTTVFNALTGLRQHTGNWPGKTVSRAEGRYTHKSRTFVLVDLPGTYSLLANSIEEEIARDFLCFGRPDAVIVVVDATCLERNLNLVLQVIEITSKVVVCVNLMDEARRKGIYVDVEGLQRELGVPAIGTVARTGEGLIELMDVVDDIVTGVRVTSPRCVAYEPELEDRIQRLLPGISEAVGDQLNPRWVALRLIEGDMTTIDMIQDLAPQVAPKLTSQLLGRLPEEVDDGDWENSGNNNGYNDWNNGGYSGYSGYNGGNRNNGRNKGMIWRNLHEQGKGRRTQYRHGYQRI